MNLKKVEILFIKIEQFRNEEYKIEFIEKDQKDLSEIHVELED